MLPKLYREPDRRYQINTLKIFNDNVVEVLEGHEYRISFQSGQNELCLNISLTQDFPNEKPLLKVAPTVVHPWVDPDGSVTSAPGLLNFSVHSDLGRVVGAIIREFVRHPPSLLTDCPTGNNTTSPTIPIRRDSERSSPIYCGMNSFTPPSSVPIMQPRRSVCPQLNDLTVEELEFLNSNLDKQQELIEDMPVIKEQNRNLDDLITQVEELAVANLSKQDQLQELREGIESRIEEVTKLAFENESLNVKYQSLAGKYSPIKIKEELKHVAKKNEQDSEEMVEKFLNGEMDVDKFVSLYTKARTLCHSLRTREEKLAHQLDSLSKAGF